MPDDDFSDVSADPATEKWLKEAYGLEIVAFVTSVGNIKLFGDTDSMSADTAALAPVVDDAFFKTNQS
ncbi:hypothetical protein FDECE_721 [Fusarium decemcellulare]|nr:hypothetical protein FDECE_721 [Fusarium decemcellulare]